MEGLHALQATSVWKSHAALVSSGTQAPGFLPSARLPHIWLEQWLIRWLDGGWTGENWASLTWVQRPVLHNVL